MLSGGSLPLTLAPHAASLLVASSRVTALPRIVNSVTPPHDALLDAAGLSAIILGFDGPVFAEDVTDVTLDGVSVLSANWCAEIADGRTFPTWQPLPLMATTFLLW